MDAELATYFSETSNSEYENVSAGGLSDIEDAEELGLNTAPPEFYDPGADDRDEQWVAKQRKGHKSDAVLSCPLCFTTLSLDCQQHSRFDNQFRAMFVMNCRVITTQVVRAPLKPARSRKRQSHQQQQQQGEKAEEGPSGVAAGEAMQLEGAQDQPGLQSTPSQSGSRNGCSIGGVQQPQSHQQQQPGQQGQGQGEQHLRQGDGGSGEGDVLHPVQCGVCDTEVGLRDAEGVFHFFNVFASNA